MSSGRSRSGLQRGEVFLRGRVEARFDAAQSERPQARDLGARHDEARTSVAEITVAVRLTPCSTAISPTIEPATACPTIAPLRSTIA